MGLLLYIIGLVVCAGTIIAVVSLRFPKRKWVILVPAGLVIFAIWTFDPMVWRVHHRFPGAKITDVYEVPFVPAILHAYWTPPHSLWGGYLEIELADQTVNMDQFRDVPFFLLTLKRCRIVGAMFTGETLSTANLGMHEDIMFEDCDFTGATNQFAF